MTLSRTTNCARGIPLWRRDGTIAAFAMVDPDEFERLSRWRWSPSGKGYGCRWERGRMIFLHRQIAGLDPGDPCEVDHKNRDRLDCRRRNLRVVPPGANQQNTRSRGGTSRWRGVSWHAPRGYWQVRVRRRTVGYFRDELAAAVAAERERLRVMPYALPDPELAAALREAA